MEPHGLPNENRLATTMERTSPVGLETIGFSPDALIQRADSLQAKASQIIEVLGLVRRWSRVGRVAMVGSSQFGLMASTNLDFEIYVERPDIAVGFEVIRAIAQTPGVRQVLYLNVLDTTDPGLYWRVDYADSEGTLWDIDQWLVPNDHPHAGVAERLVESMRQALTNETRRIILAIKAARPELLKCRGIDVYKAVLRDGVKTPDEFARWLSVHPPSLEMIETWHP